MTRPPRPPWRPRSSATGAATCATASTPRAAGSASKAHCAGSGRPAASAARSPPPPAATPATSPTPRSTTPPPTSRPPGAPCVGSCSRCGAPRSRHGSSASTTPSRCWSVLAVVALAVWAPFVLAAAGVVAVGVGVGHAVDYDQLVWWCSARRAQALARRRQRDRLAAAREPIALGPVPPVTAQAWANPHPTREGARPRERGLSEGDRAAPGERNAAGFAVVRRRHR